MSQYTFQRTQMQQLSTTLAGLETSLDAILTNLDNSGGGDLQCNT